MPSTAENIAAFLAAGLPVWAVESIDELITKSAWGELNDRFYRYLEFGTGGMRGRTIGVVTAAAETGRRDAAGSPEHAAIGSNLLNDFTLSRAVIGLFRYTQKHLGRQSVSAKPRLVIAYDVRHFSRHFCELAASTWTKLGGEAFIFDGPRPTPQLSYSVRWLKAHAGVVITASHNPPHDNGFKAYFDDGAQVVPPHDTGIVAEVNAVPLAELGAFLAIDLAGVVGHVTVVEFADQLKADAVLVAKLKSLANTHIILNAQTTAIEGDGKTVTGLTYQDRASGEAQTLTLDGVFVQIGLVPNTEFLKGTVELSRFGEIVVDHHGATNAPGVFAAGDATTVPYKQIVIAAGDGAKAALGAFDYLIRSSAPTVNAAA